MNFVPLSVLISVALVASVGGTAATAQHLPRPLDDSDFSVVSLEEAKLGQLLFYDPLLAGNRETACATCHHPAHGTGDGLSLSLGDGGMGLGPKRVVDPKNMPEQRVPRNAQPLFNLGFKGYVSLFHDGRVEADPERVGGLRTPLDEEMLAGFAGLVAAQTMFPVISADEMGGHYSENEVAKAVRLGRLTQDDGAWSLIAKRVASIPEYAAAFAKVYPQINAPADIKFTDVANAIAMFMEFEWRSDDAPFDAVLAGRSQFEADAQAGADLFYGAAGCSSCHSGPLLSDFGFHATGQPQLGPGKGARFETHARDEGRFRVTGNPDDLYAFRTPSLRNVTRTGPWGHAGAYSDLADFVVAHADPVAALSSYDRSQAVLPQMDTVDWRVMDDPVEVAAIAAAVEVEPVFLTSAQVAQITAFLKTLEDPQALTGRLGVPKSVPSGLTVPNP
ncbi:cytochrome-c peroxidase [Litoreibacter janthinus]|uniref:Cytochrome c peroxidase n=1 Tax=Litoreibacter janthinus TaxID=670154 RepID=A0A1I6FVS1_9RHOB|nr:cytochrome c peroxidase [Litoreibacter janthinus]SFR34024.1 cytochrome c peroxidase [Litoreibacter janthinus]